MSLVGPLGDETLVFLDYGGPAWLVAKVGAEDKVAVGERRRFTLHPTRSCSSTVATREPALVSRFAGRVVIVTGAAKSIGLRIVRAFAGEGARVAALDIDGAGLGPSPASARTCSPSRAT